MNADGWFAYAPAADYTGRDSFTYKSNDGNLDSNPATVSITVNAVIDAPTVTVAADGSCGANDRSGTINLTVADPDTAAAGLTLSGQTPPPHVRGAVLGAGGVPYEGDTAAITTLPFRRAAP